MHGSLCWYDWLFLPFRSVLQAGPTATARVVLAANKAEQALNKLATALDSVVVRCHSLAAELVGSSRPQHSIWEARAICDKLLVCCFSCALVQLAMRQMTGRLEGFLDCSHIRIQLVIRYSAVRGSAGSCVLRCRTGGRLLPVCCAG